MPYQFLRFASIGALCFALNLAVLIAAIEGLGWHYLVATVAALLVVTPVSWWLNRCHTFGSRSAPRPELARYVGATLISYALVCVGMYLAVDRMGITYPLANISLGVLMLGLNFVLLKSRVFRQSVLQVSG